MRSTLRRLGKPDPCIRPHQTRQIASLQSILPRPIRLPSSLATSSRITLDHPLHAPLSFTLPYFPPAPSESVSPPALVDSAKSVLDHQPDPVLPFMLTFASDEELVKALFPPSSSSRFSSSSPSRTPRSDKKEKGLFGVTWISTLDPSLAYLALRSRPTFTSFLQNLTATNIGETYELLKPSGLHERLVSDLLLRHPQDTLLATILELESRPQLNSANTKIKTSTSGIPKVALALDQLRPSLVTSIYSVLTPSSRTSLSRRANLLVSKALISQAETSLIPPLFHHLTRSTDWQPEGVWILLNLILALVRHHDIDKAIPLLHNLVADNRLPASALLGKGLSAHSEAKVLIVQTMILRAALEWRFFARARTLATELLETLKRSENCEPVWNLILDVVRVSLVGGQRSEVDWVTETLQTMSTLPPCPSPSSSTTSTDGAQSRGIPVPLSLPSSTLNTYFASVKPTHGKALQLLHSLPPHHRPRFTSSNFMRLASTLNRKVLYGLIGDMETGRVDRAGLRGCKRTFVACLARAGMEREAVRLQEEWVDLEDV